MRPVVALHRRRPILSFTPLYGQNGLKLLSIVNNIVDGLSMLEIEEMLDGDGNGFGQHDMTLGVEVETGGGLGCQSNDDGEEVRYSIELISLEYEITRV